MTDPLFGGRSSDDSGRPDPDTAWYFMHYSDKQESADCDSPSGQLWEFIPEV